MGHSTSKRSNLGHCDTDAFRDFQNSAQMPHYVGLPQYLTHPVLAPSDLWGHREKSSNVTRFGLTFYGQTHISLALTRIEVHGWWKVKEVTLSIVLPGLNLFFVDGIWITFGLLRQVKANDQKLIPILPLLPPARKLKIVWSSIVLLKIFGTYSEWFL